MVIKVKEITIGGGGKMSRRYQSQEYPCSVTVIAEDGDKPSQMIEKAKLWLIELRKVAREIAEKELLELIIEEEAAEAAKFKTGFAKVETSVSQGSGTSGFAIEDASLTDSKPLPVVVEVISTPTTTTEEVLMDLKEVTIVGETPKSYVALKNGYSKLIPFSLMKTPLSDEVEIQGKYNIILTEKGETWFHTKPWKPYVPYKRKS